MDPLRILSFVAGLALTYITLVAVIRTLVLPRSENVWLTRDITLLIHKLFLIRLHRVNNFEDRDRIMAYFAPLSLLILPIVWVFMFIFSFALLFFGLHVGDGSFHQAFHLSGSSLLTLGFFNITDTFQLILVFFEATLGLGIVALLLAYLPTIYSCFSRREKMVSFMEVRAGSPPFLQTMLERIHRNRGMDYFEDLFPLWEEWFIEIEQTHTEYASLVFFRSPRSHRSWITAAGAILDTVSFMEAVIDSPPSLQGRLVIRAGFVSLRCIADFFSIPYNPNPQQSDPISITRAEFMAVYDALFEIGLNLKSDREQAWLDFSGWRVNYDEVLLQLARMTMAPYAPWSSDRSLLGMQPKP